jgi:hypothetical protein
MNWIAAKRAEAFHEIANRPGGARGRLLAPAVLSQADAAFGSLGGAVLDEIEDLCRRIIALADAEKSPEEIFAIAHHVRGLAGSGDRRAAGSVAGAIRAYGHDAEAAFRPDWTLLRLLGAMLLHAIVSPDGVDVAILDQTCRSAVVKTMRSEDRIPPQYPW